jgi:uncharacterized membrane protein YfcA
LSEIHLLFASALWETVGLYALIFVASIITGFINTLAGSGSLIMLPLLMGMGLSAPVANGTNRVAILVQCLVGVRTFLRRQSIQLGESWWTIGVATVGAVVGAWAATQLSPAFLEQFISYLLGLMLVLILVKPEKWVKSQPNAPTYDKHWGSLLASLAVGFYGGFIQGGVGIFLMIALVNLTNYTVQRANAVKLTITAVYALPVLLVYVYFNQVDWYWGCISAIGQSVGAYIGARFAVEHPQANIWTYRLLILLLVVLLLRDFAPLFYKLFTIV